MIDDYDYAQDEQIYNLDRYLRLDPAHSSRHRAGDDYSVA